jgi:hypothetical protein
MNTLLLSLLLIALVAIGLLMASTKVREGFLDVSGSDTSVVASPVMASILATPNISTLSNVPTSPQVDTVGRDKDLQIATDGATKDMSEMLLSPSERKMVLAVRKEHKELEAQEKKKEKDENYEDDYPERRRRRDRKCPECEQCPDMSQYIKLDEIPCWNCSLP